MSDILKGPGLETMVAVHCEGCGGRFRARTWREGIACPRCQSRQVKPLVAPGGAVDYCVADRSKGYALADMRFAQWAKWSSLITPYQYEVAFLKQNRQIQEGKPPLPIHEILIQQGALTERQAVRLLEFLSLPRPDEQDGEFVRTLLATTRVDPEKLGRVQQLQMKAATRQHEVPPLCQLLVEQRVINEAQMLAVLRLQQQSGRGALHLAHEMVVRPTRRTQFGALRAALSLRNPRTRAALVILVVFLLGLGVWWRQAAANVPRMYVRCLDCGFVSEVRWSNTFPVKCPHCGRVRAVYLKVCSNGHLFPSQSPFEPEPCPVCGSPTSRPATAEDVR